MACGVPVAATDVGDARMIIDNLGEVVPPRRPDLLATAWAELLERRRQQPGFSQAVRAHIVDNFSVAAMVENTELILKRICDRLPLDHRSPDGVITSSAPAMPRT